ncbi:fimbrial biogenesis chaperone [Rahnella contaminans]|uniref:fimbrial biogenesis chaperone n=1 Tax=Rahnella contaminans TaxID=2703882 RepID=UPI003C2B4C8C
MKFKLKSVVISSLLMIMSQQALAAVSLNMTRVIFNNGSDQQTVQVNNSKQDGNFLIQSWISSLNDTPDPNISDNLIVTPPLFKLNADDKNKIKIMLLSQTWLPKDRESAFWLNVKSIPALSPDAVKSKSKLLIAVNTKIKIFVRPEGIGTPGKDIIAKGLSWHVDKNDVVIKNSTPYFVTIKNAQVGDKDITKEITKNMVSPLSEMRFPDTAHTVHAGNNMSWGYINDYGTVVNGIDTKIQ